MKKFLASLMICFLVASLSVASSAPLSKAKLVVESSSNSADAPDWAVGNFTGEWGLNIWGDDWFAIGPVNGYYGQGFVGSVKFGRFLMTYLESDGENGTSFQGLFVGPYLLGIATDLQTENSSAFVGLGSYNETAFRWRIMAMEGPTLFMRGTFNEFE